MGVPYSDLCETFLAVLNCESFKIEWFVKIFKTNSISLHVNSLKTVVRTVLPKESSMLVICLRNRVPLKVRNESKLILNDQEGHSDSFRINMESFNAF